MSDENLIGAVVNLYKDGLSFEKIAEKLEISTAKVRKALLSAGVWTNETAELVAETRETHPDWSDQRIADKLKLSLNSVQMYTPYKYGPQDEENRSAEAEKAALYRERNRGLIENPDENRRDFADLMEDEDFFLNYRLTHPADGMCGHSLKAMKLRLSVDTSGMTPEEICNLENLYSVKTGWYRDVIVDYRMPLHYLHYVIQNAFGFNNVGPHYFSLTEDEFSEITEDSLTEYCRLCGILFRFPFGNDEKEMRWDDDYDAKTSLRTWMKSKYNRRSFPTHAGTGYTYGDNQYRIWEWAKPFDFHPLKGVMQADDAQKFVEKHGIKGYSIGEKADNGFDEVGQFPYNNVLENIGLEDLLSITHSRKFNTANVVNEVKESEIIKKLFRIEEAREAMKEAEAIHKLIKKKTVDGYTLIEKVWKEKAKIALGLYFLCGSCVSLVPFTRRLTYTFGKWKINIELIEEYYDDSIHYIRKNEIVQNGDKEVSSIITDDYLYKALRKVMLEDKAVCIAKEGKEINRRSCSVDKVV